jgi:hypothetical protein
MKTLRLLTVASLVVLVISTLAPAPAYAKPSAASLPGTTSSGIDPAKTKSVKLIVDNRTGGTLYVKLSGSTSYSFATSKKGKTVFTNIKPGVYTVTMTTSACPGSLTYKRNMKGTAALRPVVCKKKK